MSMLSQLHIELSEQASELGFESLGEAEQAGYGVDYEKAKLIPPEEMAHESWLKERDDLLDDLEHLRNIYKGVKPDGDIIERTIDFITKGEC